MICIAGAGAGASRFKLWQTLLPAYCALHVAQLPGRENRIDEPAVGTMSVVVECLAAAAINQTSKHRPLILFGHSMGAVVAFELARALDQQGRTPAGLILSATTPPAGQSDRRTPDDEELKRLLLAFDSDNREIVENPELYASLAPALRADFQLLRRHRVEDGTKLADVPTLLMSGQEDPVVPAEAVALWQDHLSAPATQYSLEGGHQFPFRESISPVTDQLASLIKGLASNGCNRA
jgi:surfactin synthase thioesterase subunit